MDRPARGRTKAFEDKDVPLADITGCVCAWDGCAARFSGAMPSGWINLLAYWSKFPEMNFSTILRRTWCVMPRCARSMRVPWSPNLRTFVDWGRWPSRAERSIFPCGAVGATELYPYLSNEFGNYFQRMR